MRLIYYTPVFIFVGVLTYYFGMFLGADIMDPISYGIFWMLYIITLLAVGSIMGNFIMIKSLNNKTGEPGLKGYRGKKGKEGKMGKCRFTEFDGVNACKDQLCFKKFKDTIEVEYNNLLGKTLKKKVDPPHEMKNMYMLEMIKRFCLCKEFRELANRRGPQAVTDYIATILKSWIRLLYDADPTNDKRHVRKFIEKHGGEKEWDAFTTSETNPWHEIKKYDVFYWGLEKEFHPKSVHYCKPKEGMQSDLKIDMIKSNQYIRVDQSGAHGGMGLYYPTNMGFNESPGKGKYMPLGLIYGNYGERHNQTIIGDYGDKGKYVKINRASYGPQTTGVMVKGPPNYVRPARQYQPVSKRGWVKPLDFKVGNEQFRCLGYTHAGRTLNNFNKPISNVSYPVACINEKALESVREHPQFKWSSNEPGFRNDPKGKEPFLNLRKTGPKYQPQKRITYQQKIATYNNNYNLVGLYSGPRDGAEATKYNRKIRQKKLYNIKPNYIVHEDFDKFTSEQENDKGLGYGWHKNTERKTGKSIFAFLGLVQESQLIHQSGARVFVHHSGLNETNSYFVRDYYKGSHIPDKYLSVESGNIIKPIPKYTMFTKKAFWKIVPTKGLRNSYYLKSQENGTYLYAEKGKNGEIKFKTDILPGDPATLNPDSKQAKRFIFEELGKPNFTKKIVTRENDGNNPESE